MHYFKALAFALVLWLLPALPVWATTNVRVYVLYGQGSILTSPGMVFLAKRLRALNKCLVVTTHNWNRYGDVVRDIMKQSLFQPVVVIGYSLGGNATTWITNALPLKPFELVVSYDPSILTLVSPAGLNIKRMLLYHNTSFDPWGHARIPGLQVETVETRMPHLAVDFSRKLHDITASAVNRVARASCVP